MKWYKHLYYMFKNGIWAMQCPTPKTELDKSSGFYKDEHGYYAILWIWKMAWAVAYHDDTCCPEHDEHEDLAK